MKLLAIRLANVGRFVEPIAVEDLSGGLDVLAGPNELGKSTLLKAVKLALFARHTSRSEDVGSLRPYGGGAPVVEIELSAGTGRWRLRKRFLAQAACELQCLTSGRQWRGAEAEAELPRLLGSPAGPGDGDGRLAMLWVSQGDALQAFDPADAKRHAGGIDALEAALAREVAAVAAGERVRTLRRAVHQRLGELVTPTGRPKTRGPLDAAQKDQAARRSAREAAGRERDAILARLERLGVLKARESEIGNAVAREARRTAIDGARRALETAAAAQRHRDLAAEKLAARESERVGARARQDQAAALISELGRSSAQAAAARDALARDEGRLAGIEHELAIALHAAAEAKARIDALDREHASALAAERRAADLQRLRDGQQRAAEAAERSARAAVLAAQVRGLPVTAELVGAAQREHGDILALEGQLRTASPTITIAYEAGAGPRFASDGVALADGSVLRPRAPIVIDVPGVGSITIAPGGGEALADMEADLGAHRAALQQLLERGGARDIADLARRLEQRRAADTELAAIAAEIRTLAPQGIEQLTAEVATLRRALPDAGEADDGRASGAIAADLATARAAVTARTSEATRLESAANALRLERAALMSRIDTLGQRQAQIADELGPVEGRGARLAALAEAASAAERAANEARRELAAWAEQAPEPGSLDRLEAALAAAEGAAQAADQESASVRLEIARIEGELAAARNEDVEARFVSAGEELEVADARLQAVSDEREALLMIEAEIARTESEARDQYQAPVLARLRPLVGGVLAAADVALGAGLSPASIVRNGQTEALARLSDGTREQIAVLTRLAFARVFADTGRGVPVILDDALVYADDGRIERMFEALAEAARHHQVIVLTCRTLAFGKLGGKRLSLQPWRALTDTVPA